MEIFIILRALLLIFVKAAALGLGVFWLTLVTLYTFPSLGRLVKKWNS